MHPLFEKASALTETIIASAIEVHRDKGPGLIESIYEWCLTTELGLRGVNCVSQKVVVVEYKASRVRSRFVSICWSKTACWERPKLWRRFSLFTKRNC